MLTLSRFGRAWLRMAPAVAITWIVAAAPPGPGVREIFLAALLSVLVVASAARAEGVHDDRDDRGVRGVLRLAAERLPSHSLNLLLFLLFLALGGAVGGTLGQMLGDALGGLRGVLGVAGAAVGVLPVLAWHWPVAVLAVVAPDEVGARSPTLPWLWRGPGHTSARRLARDFGDTTRSVALLGTVYVWLGLLAAAEAYRGETAFPELVEVASYGLFFPLVAWLATVEGRRLVEAALTPTPR